MGKWSEETRAAFKVKLRAAWARKRGEKEARAVVPASSAGGGTASAEAKAPVRRGRKPKATVPAIATPKTAARTDGPAEVSVLPPAGPASVRGIDAAIEAMRADLASLERAREILQQRIATEQLTA